MFERASELAQQYADDAAQRAQADSPYRKDVRRLVVRLFVCRLSSVLFNVFVAERMRRGWRKVMAMRARAIAVLQLCYQRPTAPSDPLQAPIALFE